MPSTRNNFLRSISYVPLLVAMTVVPAACQVETDPASQSAAHPPNVLVIVADDLGYTDLGAYGSEISTPNIDALAESGVLFSAFYASPMCSPSRAMLLTGIDHHRAGLGNLASRLADNQRGQPGYEGHLAESVVTLPEYLADAGYRNYFAGKWHLGHDNGADPQSRGFDRYFALHDSGASHFDDALSLSGPEKVLYTENGEALEQLPEGFYSTASYTDTLIGYLEQDRDDDRPFFAYLAYTAPHFPLQAAEQSIARYRGHYDAGYDNLHARRLESIQALGFVPDNIESSPGSGTEPDWGSLSAPQKATEARAMEIYAAMVDDIDTNVGRLLDYLRAADEYDNTLIVFLSDNGAEGHRLSQGLGPLLDWSKECCNNSLDNMGLAGSYVMLGPGWARASMAPFRMFKGFTSEGGIRVPAIVHYPARIEGGRVVASVATIMDVMPTILDAAGMDSAESQPDGVSMLPLLTGSESGMNAADRSIGWELLGKRALRQGDWKVVRESPFSTWWDAELLGVEIDAWQLYNLAEDPAELNDLSESEPQRLESMVDLWLDYAERNGVILPDTSRSY